MSNILRNQSERADVLVHVGENLRRLRQRAGLSQAALADKAGLSRRTVVALEAGDINISLAKLDSLAAALDSSFVEIVSPPSAPSARLDTLAWRGKHADSRAMLLGSVPAHESAQLWAWTLGPGERYLAEPDPPGYFEMLFVTAGALRIDLADGPVTVAAGDYAVYSSAQQYAYVNVDAGTTSFVRTTVA